MSTKTETDQPTVVAFESGRYAVAFLTADFEQFGLLIEFGKKIASQNEISTPVIMVTPLKKEAESRWLYLISITKRWTAN